MKIHEYQAKQILARYGVPTTQGEVAETAAAAREAAEESGLAGLVIDPSPVHLDVHPITCSLGVPTRHLDVCYLATAPAGAVPMLSDESDDLRWFPLDELPAEVGRDVPALVHRARARLSAAAGR
jgi:8-oxo-dGTP pyrophosphatase MutT (NUDIX family)